MRRREPGCAAEHDDRPESATRSAVGEGSGGRSRIAGREEAWNRGARGIEDATVRVSARTAARAEGAGMHFDGEERRLVDTTERRCEFAAMPAVAAPSVIGASAPAEFGIIARVDEGVPPVHGLGEVRSVDPELAGEGGEGVGSGDPRGNRSAGWGAE